MLAAGVVAKNYAGPGVVISYLIGGVVAVLSAMCYMEFAAETSTTGASIVYSCKIFGKFVAWWVQLDSWYSCL
jgi:APA family basic amino acid/polyamine antiporter